MGIVRITEEDVKKNVRNYRIKHSVVNCIL